MHDKTEQTVSIENAKLKLFLVTIMRFAKVSVRLSVRPTVRQCIVFGNDVFSKHLFPMVSYTQNTHKISIPSNPRSTLLPSPLPRPLQPV